MNILSSLKNLISPSDALLCPRCEKPLDGHDRAACERRMSRRYFFGAALGGVAAAVAVKAAALEYGGGQLQEFVVTGAVQGNTYLTMEMITTEALRVLRNNLVVASDFNRVYDGFSGGKVGDTINIRKPSGWVTTEGSSLLRPGDKFTIEGVYAVNPKRA